MMSKFYSICEFAGYAAMLAGYAWAIVCHL